MNAASAQFAITLHGLNVVMRGAAFVSKSFRARLRERNLIGQIVAEDTRTGRWFEFRNGKIRSRAGIHKAPDVTISYATAALAAQLTKLPVNWRLQVEAAKSYQLRVQGDPDKVYWFAQTLMKMQQVGWKFGTSMSDGSIRYTSMTNGGPCFVYVKDGKILRITPISFDQSDNPSSFTISARGRSFTPPPKTTLAVHGLSSKSIVYSPDRLLFPMKRIDFDPNGARNSQNRGKSPMVRINWDEALEIVSSEIKRVKRDYGTASMLVSQPSHHMWGNIGYWLSSLFRFSNAVGHSKVLANPDSWEGWYWGAQHHWGYSMRLGCPEGYSTVEDLIKNAEQVIFWSSDPEATSGCYGGYEGTVRRQWLKELNIPIIHIDPYYNSTAAFLGGTWIAPRPGTDAAMALAIAYVWITEGLYDKNFVQHRCHGFDIWKAYVLGTDDGMAKTPEWQEKETGIEAHRLRALARQWGSKRTYVGAGGWGNSLGGACRGPTGHQWARSVACLMAMQGLGRPGVNLGNLQWGTPVDLNFYFPGYAEGGISGDLANTALSVSLYQRMPQVLTMNTVMQQVPRMELPEAILHGSASGYPRDGRSMEGQFLPVRYPAPGQAPIKMLYRYGGSNFGTMPGSGRYREMYRSEQLEFVVNQSIWREGEVPYADVVLPACTSFERWDISEWSALGGFTHHAQQQLNHRVVTMQHKCIEPLGESKSDYEIFRLICEQLDLGAYFSEGMSELDWVRRMFEASDLPAHISWRAFLKKGYFVVPSPSDEKRPPVGMRWFYEGRKKDVPDPQPLPCEYKGNFEEGLQTPTGKFEFECQSLKRFAPDDEERPPILKYVASHEGLGTPRASDYPLQLVSPHSRYSFHTHTDGKDSFINDIEDHRIRIAGYDYWVLRISPDDARERNIKNKSLVRVFNERGSVICAATITPRLVKGVVHGYDLSARFDPANSDGSIIDRGGSLNILTSPRTQFKRGHSMGSSNCLVEIEPYSFDSTTNANAAKFVSDLVASD